MQQEPDAVLGQVGRAVPAVEHRVDVEVIVLAHGHQRAAGDERGDLAFPQLATGGVQRHRIRRHEQVRGVPVQLRPLVLGDRVLHGERVQAQLLADRGQLVGGRPAQVEPDDRGLVGQMVGHVGDREALGFEDSVAVHAGAVHEVTSFRENENGAAKYQPVAYGVNR